MSRFHLALITAYVLLSLHSYIIVSTKSSDKSRSLILTHSEQCDNELPESKILSKLLDSQKDFEVLGRRLLEASHNTKDDDDNNHDDDHQLKLTKFTSKIISSAYDRMRSERDSEHQAKRRRALQTVESSADSRFLGHKQKHKSQKPKSSDGDKEDRRDKMMALLEVAFNADIVAAASSHGGADMKNYKKLKAHYLPNLQIDIIETSVDSQNPLLLLELASQLPCLESRPELDSDKTVNDIMPNDLRTSGTPKHPDLKQWGLLGPDSGELYGTDATKAWETFSGSSQPGMVVGVVDTGCSFNPDLAPNLCKKDDVECAGYDFGDDDDNPFDEPLSNQHGTSVASVIAAQPFNDFGLAGICWSCRIMCLKVYDSSKKRMGLASVLKAYDYMIEKKVKLSNHSYTSQGRSENESRAIEKLEQAGHLMVAAAGNSKCDLDEYSDKKNCNRLTAPAGYEFDNILTVGSITRQGSLSKFSSFGQKSVDIMAPGSDIPVLQNTLKHGSYLPIGVKSGTSFAAPHVTGVAALVWGRNPNLTYQEVKDVILSTATPLPNLQNLSFTGGILNAAAAVAAVKDGITEVPWSNKPRPTADLTPKYYGIEIPRTLEWDSFYLICFILIPFCAVFVVLLFAWFPKFVSVKS